MRLWLSFEEKYIEACIFVI